MPILRRLYVLLLTPQSLGTKWYSAGFSRILYFLPTFYKSRLCFDLHEWQLTVAAALDITQSSKNSSFSAYCCRGQHPVCLCWHLQYLFISLLVESSYWKLELNTSFLTFSALIKLGCFDAKNKLKIFANARTNNNCPFPTQQCFLFPWNQFTFYTNARSPLKFILKYSLLSLANLSNLFLCFTVLFLCHWHHEETKLGQVFLSL